MGASQGSQGSQWSAAEMAQPPASPPVTGVGTCWGPRASPPASCASSPGAPSHCVRARPGSTGAGRRPAGDLLSRGKAGSVRTLPPPLPFANGMAEAQVRKDSGLGHMAGQAHPGTLARDGLTVYNHFGYVSGASLSLKLALSLRPPCRREEGPCQLPAREASRSGGSALPLPPYCLGVLPPGPWSPLRRQASSLPAGSLPTQPWKTRGGLPASLTPRPGCVWGSGTRAVSDRPVQPAGQAGTSKTITWVGGFPPALRRGTAHPPWELQGC